MSENIQRLAEKYAGQLHQKFPDLEISGVGSNIADPKGYWIFVNYPVDDFERFRVREYAAELSSDYLDQHSVLITPVSGQMVPGQ